MGEKIISNEFKYILELLDESLNKMEDIIGPKAGTVFWRLIFPAGQFMQQKSSAKAAAAILANIGTRLNEMMEVLEEKNHPLTVTIQQLCDINLFAIAEKLMELPERAQYLITEIENFQKRIEALVKSIDGK